MTALRGRPAAREPRVSPFYIPATAPVSIQGRRVLKHGGSLHLLDFVRAHGAHSGAEEHGPLIHRRGPVAERIEGRMTSLLDEAGFVDAQEVTRGKIFFGPIAYYRAGSPA